MNIVHAPARLLRRHRFGLAVFGAVFLFALSAGSLVVANGQSLAPTDSHIISVFDKGEETIIPTRATTVGELLDKLDITLRENDLVEPAIDTPILEDNIRVNVYRARPVTVFDSGRQVTVLTPHSSPRLIAADAGIFIEPEDKATFAQPDDILDEGIIGEKMFVERSIPVQIAFYGTLIATRTVSKTVGELLSEKKIEIGEGDVVQPSDLSTPVQADMLVAINLPGKQVVTTEEPIPFESESTNDASLPLGKVVIKTPGVPGRRIALYELEIQDGREIGRRLLQSVIADQPRKQIQVKGTKVMDTSNNVVLGERMAADAGWTGEEWTCLYQLWLRESGWNHLSSNRGGSGAYGIPQALPGSKMGPGWEYDPEVQIRWGLGYIKGRYGTPCRAWNFFLVNRHY